MCLLSQSADGLEKTYLNQSINTFGYSVALEKGVFMPEYIIRTKNKKEEKVVKAFLSSLNIHFHTKAQEEEVLYPKMANDHATGVLTETEKDSFIKQLKFSK